MLKGKFENQIAFYHRRILQLKMEEMRMKRVSMVGSISGDGLVEVTKNLIRKLYETCHQQNVINTIR